MRPVALITGCLGGVGSATVRAFSAAGWSTAGTDLASTPHRDLPLDDYACLDLSLADARREFDRAIGRLPRLDALVNNAAYQVEAPIEETDLDDWDRTFATNVRGAFLAMQAAFAALRTTRGAVVNVSSVHAMATSPGLAAYAASKGALNALTRAAALEVAADGVRVNAVLPGAVDTPMLRRGVSRWSSVDPDSAIAGLAARTPLRRVATADEIAQAVLFLSDRSRSSFVTGQLLVVDGGALGHLSTE